MRQSVLTLADYLKPALEFLLYAFKRFFTLIGLLAKAFIDARQKQTNYNIALQLWKTEYRKESFDTVLAAVNRGDLNALRDS